MTIPGFFQAAEAILKSGRTEEGSVFFDLYNSYGVLPTTGLSGHPFDGSMTNRAGSPGNQIWLSIEDHTLQRGRTSMDSDRSKVSFSQTTTHSGASTARITFSSVTSTTVTTISPLMIMLSFLAWTKTFMLFDLPYIEMLGREV
jgi:hypothetical protein